MNTHEHDQTEQRLTQALHDEAADVHPSPGALQTIQRRTSKDRVPSRHRWLWVAGTASLATAAVVTGIVLVGGSDDGTTGAPVVDQPSEGSLTAAFDVWFYGDQPGNPEGPGPRDPSVFAPLYAERHVVEPTAGSLAEQAVRTFLTAGHFDPDYASGWPSGVEVEKVSTGGGATIALTGTADLETRGDLTAGEAHSAIQALLRTAGAAGEASFTYNGEPLDQLFGMPTPIEVLPYGDGQLDSLRAPITVDLSERQQVDNPVRIPVTGNVFEGTVNWELLDDTGSALDDGFVTAGSTEWEQVDIDLGTLEPGTYTIRAFEVSVADGDEIYTDTKNFRVE